MASPTGQHISCGDKVLAPIKRNLRLEQGVVSGHTSRPIRIGGRRDGGPDCVQLVYGTALAQSCAICEQVEIFPMAKVQPDLSKSLAWARRLLGRRPLSLEILNEPAAL
jgi:hypothetical protein